jgi:tetratricopeptide (TPR) repeat protein
MSVDPRVRELVRRIQETDATPEDVCRECPELLPEVRSRWDKLRAFDQRFEAFFPSASGAGDASSRQDAAAPVFPDYDVAELLGSGGMGDVYKARELETGRVVALKVIHPHLRGAPGLVERFAREAEIGQQVVHENVVRTLGLAPDATRLASRQALITEYVEGQTLRALIKEMGRVPEQLCRHVGREIAKGLAAIHMAGAVHRDLKPDNVLITRDDVVKVMDLGVAKLSDADVNLTDAFVGSLRYAAPEQMQRGGAALDGRADLYALGLTLYELSTGRLPFPSRKAPTSGQAVDTKLLRAGELNPQLSAFFEEFLATLLENDRERRFADARGVAEILDRGEESSWWRERSGAIRRATRNAPRRTRIARDTALHGRDADIALLRAAFACATNGDGRVVLVQGEAGVGKSRLVDEFLATLSQEAVEHHALFGGYAPGGAATPSGAFSAAYREFLGDQELAAALRRHLPQNPSLIPPFAALLRGEQAPDGTVAMTKDAVQTAFTRTTQSLAEERPTVVVIEDLHFAPDEGRALFATLALAVPGHRILLVGTSRRNLDAQWVADLRRLPQTSRLPLQRLERHQLTALLSEALRSAQSAEELAPQIDKKSDGNPYFIFELLRGLRESGMLKQAADGTWAAPQTIRDVPNPSSITDLVAARFAGLPPEERELIEVAACCGFEFDPLLVGDVLGLERLPLLRRLGTLEAVRRLVRSTGRTCFFDHHQIQEVVYAGLSQTHRESFHAAIAATLERRTGAAERDVGDVDGGLCAVLAGHLLDGGDGTRALRYLDSALDHLERGWKNEAVVRLIDRALSVATGLNGVQRCALVLRRAKRIDFIGERDESLKALREAVSLADAVGDSMLRARSRALLGGRVTHAGANDEAVRLLEDSIEIWRSIGDRRGEAEALGLLAAASLVVGRYDDAGAYQRRRLALASEVGDLRNQAQALAALGNLLLVRSEHDDAADYYERAADVARRAGDRVLEGQCVGNFANVYSSVGRFEDSRVHHEVALARARESGDRASEARVSGNLANVLWSLGYFADARAKCAHSVRLLRETGHRLGEAISEANLASILTSLGRHDDALLHLAVADRIGTDLGSRHVKACVCLFSGFALGELGRRTEAMTQFEQAIEEAQHIGDRLFTAAALLGLGEEFEREGRNADAIRTFDEAAAISAGFGLLSISVGVAAERAAISPGGVEALAALLECHRDRVDILVRIRAEWILWRTRRDAARLAEARRLVDFVVAHAPDDCRTSVVENVHAIREVRASSTT